MIAPGGLEILGVSPITMHSLSGIEIPKAASQRCLAIAGKSARRGESLP
jgi:hypothetical protein